MTSKVWVSKGERIELPYDYIWPIEVHNKLAIPVDHIDGNAYVYLSGAQNLATISGHVFIDNLVESTNETIDIADGAIIIFNGLCRFKPNTVISVGSNCVVRGWAAPEIVDACFVIKPTAVNSRIFNISGRYSSLLQENWGELVLFDASAASVPRNCEVHHLSGYHCNATVKVRGSNGCHFHDISSASCVRPAIVYSSTESQFERFTSYSNRGDGLLTLPIVGFLNIPERTQSFGRGTINCKYRDIYIYGFAEEGFSFDARGNEPTKRALVLNTHIASLANSGVSLVSDAGAESLVGYDLIFQTGLLAGNRYTITAQSSKDVTLDLFNSAASAAVGDFVGIEVSCHSNTVDNVSVKSYGDRSGISVWLWGGYTEYLNSKLDGCIVAVYSTASNVPNKDGVTYYGAPHHLKFVDTEFKNEFSVDGRSVDGWIPYDSDLLCGYTFDQNSLYSDTQLGDSSVSSTEMCIIGAEIIGNLPAKMVLKNVRSMRIPIARTTDDIENATFIVG